MSISSDFLYAKPWNLRRKRSDVCTFRGIPRQRLQYLPRKLWDFRARKKTRRESRVSKLCCLTVTWFEKKTIQTKRSVAKFLRTKAELIVPDVYTADILNARRLVGSYLICTTLWTAQTNEVVGTNMQVRHLLDVWCRVVFALR